MSFISQTSQWQPPMVLAGPTSAPTSAPSSTVPTSAPKKAGDKERKPKLRASCDACAASKVKCSKEHPICARCTTNGSQCIYGVSRKHGKPGRTRKRNPDGTPFVKASKQRPSPDGSEFGKFRIRPEPIAASVSSVPDMLETTSNWSSAWSSNSLPSTPELEFEMTPEPFYMDTTDLSFMDDILMPTPKLDDESLQTVQPELTFRDPFSKKPSMQIEMPDLQALKDFIGGDMVSPLDYSLQDTPMDPIYNSSASSSPQSPRSNPMDSPANFMRLSISMPTSHCCYTLAYSTLESLRVISSDGIHANPTGELKSLDAVLSTAKLAVSNVLQLLSCPCSADPHLAMLYSSITSKILTWYQIAAGTKVTASSAISSSSASSSGSSSPCSSAFSSPLTTPTSELERFSIQPQPLKFGLYEFNAAEQEQLRRRVVLTELKKCGQLVDALATWRGEGKAEQGEFLYDVLGAWLKSELYRTVQEIESAQDL